MKAKYFNTLEFEQASSLMDTNPLESKIRFENYISKYPKDYSAYTHYAGLLITLCELDEAEKILEYVEKLYSNDDKFCSDESKFKLFESNLVYIRLRLLAYREKYDELYDFYLKNSHKVLNMNYNHIFFYSKKKLGKLEDCIREGNSYLFRQIIEYSEEDFFEHIKKHLADFNKDSDNPNKNIFAYDFPINKVVEELKKYIPSNKKMYGSFYQDEYVFKYDGCGRENNKITDYFKVICFHNTNNIITLCPIIEGQNLLFIDLNYLVVDNEKSKIKKMSQIDKFNRRYKKNDK